MSDSPTPVNPNETHPLVEAVFVTAMALWALAVVGATVLGILSGVVAVVMDFFDARGTDGVIAFGINCFRVPLYAFVWPLRVLFYIVAPIVVLVILVMVIAWCVEYASGILSDLVAGGVKGLPKNLAQAALTLVCVMLAVVLFVGSAALVGFLFFGVFVGVQTLLEWMFPGLYGLIKGFVNTGLALAVTGCFAWAISHASDTSNDSGFAA